MFRFLSQMATNSEQSDARLRYLEKRRADTVDRVRRCRARQAENEEQQAQTSTLRDGRLVVSRSFDTSGRQAQCFSAKVALKIAAFTAEHLEGVHPLVQNEVVCKFLGHPVVRDIVPTFLQDVSVVHQNHEVIRNMKTGILMHLAGSRKSHLVMAKDIICTLASSENITSSRSVADLLGVDRMNIKKGLDRRVQLDLENEAFWRTSRRCRCSDAISEETKALVISWWTKETQISPNRKDIRRRLRGLKDYKEHATHYLQTSQVCHCFQSCFSSLPVSSVFRDTLVISMDCYRDFFA
jgi:hypothetical protein